MTATPSLSPHTRRQQNRHSPCGRVAITPMERALIASLARDHGTTPEDAEAWLTKLGLYHNIAGQAAGGHGGAQALAPVFARRTFRLVRGGR